MIVYPIHGMQQPVSRRVVLRSPVLMGYFIVCVSFQLDHFSKLDQTDIVSKL
jgi:hypothetical protein